MIFGAIKSGLKAFGNAINPVKKRRTFASIAYDKKRDDVINGYKKIMEDENNVAYRDNEGNVKIGIAGTHSLKDVITDIKVLGGKKIEDTQRYKQSEDFIKKINEKYRPKKMELETHSLSGMIGNKLADKYDFITGGKSYNPFLLNKSQISKKIENVRSPFDIVSGLVSPNIKTDYSKILNTSILDAHGVEQFSG